MKPETCTSFGLPFTDESRGTNRDQTESKEYSINCFQNRSFVEAFLSLRELEVRYFE